MDLVFGIALGFIFAALLVLAAGGYYLYTLIRANSQELTAQKAAHTEYVTQTDAILAELKSQIETETKERREAVANLDGRLKHFENIKIADNLSLEDELRLGSELKRRIEKNLDMGEDNFLDVQRDAALAAHNAEYHGGSN
jgi:uncharacterized protein YlxW (UPF0749 family)